MTQPNMAMSSPSAHFDYNRAIFGPYSNNSLNLKKSILPSFKYTTQKIFSPT